MILLSHTLAKHYLDYANISSSAPSPHQQILKGNETGLNLCPYGPVTALHFKLRRGQPIIRNIVLHYVCP